MFLDYFVLLVARLLFLVLLVAHTLMAVELEFARPGGDDGVAFFREHHERGGQAPTADERPHQVERQPITAVAAHAFAPVLVDPDLVVREDAVEVEDHGVNRGQRRKRVTQSQDHARSRHTGHGR